MATSGLLGSVTYKERRITNKTEPNKVINLLLEVKEKGKRLGGIFISCSSPF